MTTQGAALDITIRNERGAGRRRRTAAGLILAVLLLLGGCATGTGPAPGEHAHVVIGYDAAGARTLLLQPVPGGRLSSTFGVRKDPFSGTRRAHQGVDYAAPPGTPVRAAGDGIVVTAGPLGSYGHYVRIRHDDRFETAYAHLGGYAGRLGQGRRVRQGQVIGYVGSSGRSTGPHLHYEVLVHGTQVDPFRIETSIAQAAQDRALAAWQAVRARVDDVRDLVADATGGLIGPSDRAATDIGGPGE